MRRSPASLAVLLLLVVAFAGCKKSEASTTQNRELFANVCARCHGQDGAGGSPAYAGGPAPRNFRDHAFQSSRTDEQLKATIRNGKGLGMPAFGGSFDDAQLAVLIEQIRSFDPERK